MYSIVRLIVIAFFITYLIGCLNFFISDFGHSKDEINAEKTFLVAFGIKDYDENGIALEE